MVTLQQTNQDLQTLDEQIHAISKENKTLKETMLDLQTRSMRDNLIFSGISEQTPDNPENLKKNFMKTQLKIPPDTVQNITFHRVHRLGKPSTKGPWPNTSNKKNWSEAEEGNSKEHHLDSTNNTHMK